MTQRQAALGQTRVDTPHSNDPIVAPEDDSHGTAIAESERLCLIGGTGRSGTTILSAVFERHPDIHGAPESRFLIDPGGVIDFLDSGDSWSPFHADYRLRQLERILRAAGRVSLLDAALVRLARSNTAGGSPVKLRRAYGAIGLERSVPSYPELVDALIDDLCDFTFAGDWDGMRLGSQRQMRFHGPLERPWLRERLSRFLLELFRDATIGSATTHYLEKNTWNILWFDRILELLPQARLVHIIRDPRDVVASYTQQLWAPADPIQSAVMLRSVYDRWDAVARNVPTDSWVTVRLEDLVADRSGVLESICGFWELAPNTALDDVELRESSFGKWKSMKKADRDSVTGVLGTYIDRFGYGS